MPKRLLTEDNIKFIKKNRLKISGSDMARLFGVDRNIVGSYMRKNGLTVPKEIQVKFRREANTGRTTSTPAMDKEIRKHYLTMPEKTLASHLRKSHCFVKKRIEQLGLVIPREIIEQRKKLSQYSKGQVPFNKGKKMSPEVYKRVKATMFKKGNVPPNTKEKNGIITVRHDHRNRPNSKPYKYIRISLGVWKPYHQYRWEKFRGKVPKGHCLWFKDGDSMNCALKNLECITRAENARRNKSRYDSYPQELKDVIQLTNKINKKIYEKHNCRSTQRTN